MSLSSPLRQARACWRLARVTVHVLHGAWVARRTFATASPAQRHERIRWWSAKLLRCLGLELQTQGRFGPSPQLLVANHISWLDISALHAVCPEARFVSKADVKAWPLLGGLITQAGTLFIERESRRDAMRVVHQSAEALQAGDTVAFFPEGTTADGHQLLPFHANLLQAAVTTGTDILPVALRFSEPGHVVSPAAAYIGDTTLVQSLWRIACAEGLTVRLHALAPVPVAGQDRRALSQQVRGHIEAALEHLGHAAQSS